MHKGHSSAKREMRIPRVPQLIVSGDFSAGCSGLLGQDAMSTTPYLSWSYRFMVGEAGLEPTTPGLEGRCSIQLSYSPLQISF